MNRPSDNPDTCCPVCHGDGALTEGERLQVTYEAQTLASLRSIRDYAASEASKTLGTAIQLCVSGNGTAWRVFVGDLPLSPQSCENSFETALGLAAQWVREQAKATP